MKWKESKKCLFCFEAKQSEKTFISFRFEAKRQNRKRNVAKQNIFSKRNRAKIRCIDFALVRCEKFDAKRSEICLFSRERAKRIRNGSRFASFCFEAKKFCFQNRRTLSITSYIFPPHTNGRYLCGRGKRYLCTVPVPEKIIWAILK